MVVLLMACTEKGNPVVDALNEKAYDFHYRNLDSTRACADSALALAKDYPDGKAEALNNLAFVEMAAMNYAKAGKLLDEVPATTDNQLELLVADVQQMKLCQKRSQNKDFYVYSEQARRRLGRIHDEDFTLNDHERRRLTYAESEYYIVSSAYYYYVGLTKQAADMLQAIDPYGSIERDTAQLLNYWYNIGAGGIISGLPRQQTVQKEFEYLAACYDIALRFDYPYWQAQALQSMSEHLQDTLQRPRIIEGNLAAIVSVNADAMPDSLLAGNLAQRALDIFSRYGDVYQTAGAWRTLAECYWAIGDNRSALICLNHSLNDNRAINQAPDLVASIREDLCLVYSAADDKRNSDINRNIYLDLQEQTRQDRQLEARAAQLNSSVRSLNIMIAIVAFMIVVVTVLLIVIARLRKRNDDRFSMSALLQPLSLWQQHNVEVSRQKKEHYEAIGEATDVAKLHLQQARRRNLEQRAKVQLVCSIMPLIDRMVNEVKRLRDAGHSPEAARRMQYIVELTDSINDNNNVLTQWIQMRQGELSLRIENFPLKPVFDIVSRSAVGFSLKGISLVVKSTDAVVKADRTLTLFMVNTIADNARKFTPAGGTVSIAAEQTGQYVEISVTDNGRGMTDDTLAHIFDRTYTGGHGFGLKNCKGIIEKYKKISSLFNVCLISAKSRVGEGTRIFFRLPLGRLRMIVAAMLMSASLAVAAPAAGSDIVVPAQSVPSGKAAAFADSAYLSNVMGDYTRTLRYADSCRRYISPTDTTIMLDISNEAAVAALALHRWDVYRQNNNVYTHLFRQASADSTLPDYVRAMQRSQTNKTVAVVLLVMMLMVIFPAYYFLYYRHKLNYQFCIDRIGKMNVILLSDVSDEAKLHGIEELGDFSRFNLTAEQSRSLKSVVERIIAALRQNIADNEALDTEAELAGDECHRLELEADRLHVSNNVLDNCLSTLKHETMYYPSRIRQMMTREGTDLGAVSEVVNYYHDLYAILAEQALRQVLPQRMGSETVQYMLDILTKCNDRQPLKVSTGDSANGYARVSVVMSALKVSDSELANLFTPQTVNLDFLLCRQIVREMGEATNLRACGIAAARNADGQAVVNILMPERFCPPADNPPNDGEISGSSVS